MLDVCGPEKAGWHVPNQETWTLHPLSLHPMYVEDRMFSSLEDDCNFFHLFVLWVALLLISHSNMVSSANFMLVLAMCMRILSWVNRVRGKGWRHTLVVPPYSGPGWMKCDPSAVTMVSVWLFWWEQCCLWTSHGPLWCGSQKGNPADSADTAVPLMNSGCGWCTLAAFWRSTTICWVLCQGSVKNSHSNTVNTADGFGHLRWKTHNDRAFAIAAPTLWNTLPVNIESPLKTLNLCLKLSSCWFWIQAEFDSSLFTYVCIHYAFIVLCLIYICYFVLCFRPVQHFGQHSQHIYNNLSECAM